MKAVGKSKLKLFGGLAARAFILACVASVFLPMPRYARSLDEAQFMVWLARLSWVLLLTVGVGAALLVAGWISGRLQNKTRKTR
jgi:hypothetical protein